VRQLRRRRRWWRRVRNHRHVVAVADTGAATKGAGADGRVRGATARADRLSDVRGDRGPRPGRSTVALFDAAGRLDAVLSEYRKAMDVADATARVLADQRDAVWDNRRRVDRLRSQLCEAKTEMTANVSRMKYDRAKDFGVYATGYEPGGETTSSHR